MFLHAAKVVKPPPVLTLSVKPQRKVGGALGEGKQTTVLKQGFGSKKKNGNFKIRMSTHYPSICTLLHASYESKYFTSL